MKLSKNSWHYKLNKWYTHGVPKNLCGYFWRTVWYTIVFIPTVILFIPYWIIGFFDKNEQISNKHEDIVDLYPGVLLINVILFTLYCMIAMWFSLEDHEQTFSALKIVFGGVGWFLVLIGIAYAIEQKVREKRRGKQKRPNIFVEYIKAKKNKYCPIIEWEEENDEGIEVLQEG